MMAKIMIADDAAFMRGSLKFIFESAGHEVVGIATSGKEAVELYKQYKPDLVTMDILMRGGDGLGALSEIMSLDPLAKVVMVTALGQETKEQQARALGAAGYIRKPFKREAILGELNRLLATPTEAELPG